MNRKPFPRPVPPRGTAPVRPAQPDPLLPQPRVKRPIDMIALDLDGTLFGPADDAISPRNRAAIDAALRAGIRVVLVTGRGIDTPVKVSKELKLNLPVICCHGALTKDFGANKVLGHIPVPLVHAKKLIDFGEANQLDVAVYADEYFWRREGGTPFMDDMTGPAWKETPSLHDVLHEAPTFIRFLGKSATDAVREEFADVLPLNFRFESWGEFVECAILSRDAGKQQALARLAADFQVPAERVLAIGDSRNDVPMLQWSGIGVAMGNALPEVRNAVRYTTAGNDADGVALAIERFALTTDTEKKPA